MGVCRLRARAGAFLAFALVCSAALAHDSWLARASQPRDAAVLRLQLGTGNRYPKVDVAPPPESVAASSCIDAAGNRFPLLADRVEGSTLALRSPGRGPLACWVELRPATVRLEPAIVEVYFREARPNEEVRAQWADQLARGAGWEETYRKFTRIELDSATASSAQMRKLRAPLGLPLEIVPIGDEPLRTGETARFQVLADGKALPGLSVELVSERSPIGVWSRSDADGGISWQLPFPGAWLVRAIRLQRDDATMQWHSRFATLAIDVTAAAPPPPPSPRGGGSNTGASR